MSPHDSRNAGELRSSKRRRIAMACVPCRTRKSRCDGARPLCQTCRDLGYDCKYSEAGSSSNVIVGKEYLTGLEERLEAVEQSLRDINTRTGDHVPTMSPQERRRESTGESIERADAMGAVIFADESESGYFGPSSNIAFLRAIADVMLEENVTLHSPENMATGTQNGRVPHSPKSRSRQGTMPSNDSCILLQELPTDAEAMKLIKNFFANTGYLFPYMHEALFIERYKRTLTPTRQKPSRSWLSLLNMVFAMSVSAGLSEGLSALQRRQRTESYVQKALALSNTQMLRGANLDTVHFLLLWGQYLQGTQKPLEAWTVQGLAVKAVFQLGLHRSATVEKLEPVEREIRKRTWLGCVCLDRTMSLTFGRPPSIPQCYVRDEVPTPFLSSKHPGPSPPTVEQLNPGNVSFFAATIKLYGIQAAIIDQLYGQNLGYGDTVSVADSITPLFAMDMRLADWQSALPEGLKMISPEEVALRLAEEGPQFKSRLELKLRTVLTLRFLNVRLLLHRPILLRCLSKSRTAEPFSAEDALLQQIGPNSIKACLDNATHIVKLVHATVTSAGSYREILGAWWFSLYYAFNAALTVFACFLSYRPASSRLQSPALIDGTQTLELLGIAIHCLQLLDTENTTIDRCRHCLQILEKSAIQTAGNITAAEHESFLQVNLVDDLFNYHDLSTGFTPEIVGGYPDLGANEFFGGIGF